MLSDISPLQIRNKNIPPKIHSLDNRCVLHPGAATVLTEMAFLVSITPARKRHRHSNTRPDDRHQPFLNPEKKGT